MTRAVRDRILKDANGDISDHLRNHIHLTNCIHLKNHMHKHSPIMADRSIMRDLVVLQRSRSLRDPSASPSSWHSPSIIELLHRKGENDLSIREGRRSVGLERRRDNRRLSGSSPPLDVLASSKVVPSDISGKAAAMSELGSNKSGVRGRRRARKGESDRRNSRNDFLVGNEEIAQDQEVNDLVNDIMGHYESKDGNSKPRGKHVQDVQTKTSSEQLKDVPMDGDNVVSSNIHLQGRHSREEKTAGELETSIRGHCNGLNTVKRRKFRAARRTRAVLASRDNRCQNELSVASNSYAQASVRPKYHIDDGEEEYSGQNVTRAPKSGCGIPWNWSRIHHRGKSFLDIAGRRLSCGLSESMLRRGGVTPRGRDASDMPIVSDYSSSPSKYETEAVPLLIDGSQESTENVGWVHDYSGELGIFADHLLKHDADSDLVSEARSGYGHKLKQYNRSRHENLTQKYMPRSFKDLIGQNLVAQALSNAVMKRKVGLLYVFYGPHGTGKSSCARIFARTLNCQSLEHPKPCGFCNSCIAHDMGKNRNIREVGPVSNFDFEGIMEILDDMIVSQLPSQYRVFIFDDCNTLSPECWSAITKVIDRAPRRVVFVLVSSNLDVLPHIIISRCQKFFFPKLKDAEIIHTLQLIATKENLEIDVDALKLIASRSDGSLRDAEMTLEQLSLLGQRISVPLVQELVGLISDEKLVDLLDLALSADTVNTVKNLRVVMETGVEPLALMSQLATVITDILAGSYDFTKDRLRRKFFRRQPLTKQDMEKLRQALKTLSEAEKQLRMSNDKLTWLTAALLQLAPDRQYMLPSSSADTSFNHSPLAVNNTVGRDIIPKGGEHPDMHYNGRGLPTNGSLELHHVGSSGDFYENGMIKGSSVDRKRHAAPGMVPPQTYVRSAEMVRLSSRQIPGNSRNGIEEIWMKVLEKIQNNSIKEFLYHEGKLISVNFGTDSTVQLMFSSHLTKSKAEKFSGYILQAFESVLGSQVTIEIRCEPKKDAKGIHVSPILPTSENGSLHMVANPEVSTANRKHMAGYDDAIQGNNAVHTDQGQLLHPDSHGMGGSEIVEIAGSPEGAKSSQHVGKTAESDNRRLGTAWVGEVTASHKNSSMVSIPERRKLGGKSQSLVRGKVSLAHVIQQVEGCAQQNAWSRHRAVSIAEKLEQENLRLEPKSRNLLCWKASRVTRGKLSRVKIRSRKPHSLLKLVSCGKCLLSKSPR